MGSCLSGSGQVRFHPLTVSCAGNAVIDRPKNSKQEKQQTGGHDFAVLTSLRPGVTASLRSGLRNSLSGSIADASGKKRITQGREDAGTPGRKNSREKTVFLVLKRGIEQKITKETKGSRTCDSGNDTRGKQVLCEKLHDGKKPTTETSSESVAGMGTKLVFGE